jgi:hypothetical protein
LEKVKCNRQLCIAEETGEVGDESDEEINHLKQRIRMRRRQRQEEKQRHLIPISLLSDGKTDSKYIRATNLWIFKSEVTACAIHMTQWKLFGGV